MKNRKRTKQESSFDFDIVWLMQVLTAACILALSTACTSAKKTESQAGGQASTTRAEALPDEVTLKADRANLDDLRKEVPAETRQENDELALILQTFGQGDEEPSKVRERFNTAVRERRTKNDRELRTQRDDFTKTEKSERETFLKKLQTEREKIAKQKLTTDQRREFFNGQETKRRTYFAAAGEKRNAFEAQATARRKAFEDHIQEKTNQFNQAHREYSTAFYERKKTEALKKRAAAASAKSGSKNSPSGAGPHSPSGSGSGVGPGATAAESADPYGEWKDIPKGPTTNLGVPPADGK